MKKRVVFFVALFALSAFINAANVNESLGSVSQEVISSAVSTQSPLTCQQTCALHWLVYCKYGGWPVNCDAQYQLCIAACP